MVEHDRWNLTLPRPTGTDTLKALGDEVLSLQIGASPETPWQGRGPLSFLGLSASLLADIESTVSGNLGFVGKAILPFPSTMPEEQVTHTLTGLRTVSLAAIPSKESHGHHTGDSRTEWRRIDLTPDLGKAGLDATASALHDRVLAACGIAPGMLTASGNAGAIREQMRAFALTTLDPLARMITPELSRKIGVSRLGLQDLMSADARRAVPVLSALWCSRVFPSPQPWRWWAETM
ncbi:hypothetical protein [Paracoccus sp. DMF]|uniref:hypothetical protein n=1 Tax=Paracoccus sp. DMF TaxID=400837 RepID=UPI001104CB6B|nr:hypothetical protein [Paracoccus sp. DMF]MCV2447929.1 hypothetical protein [Paracoccus sp. DMF]